MLQTVEPKDTQSVQRQAIRQEKIQGSVQFSHSVMSDSLRPHESQHARPPCPSPTPGFTQTHVHQVGDAIQPSEPPAYSDSEKRAAACVEFHAACYISLPLPLKEAHTCKNIRAMISSG